MPASAAPPSSALSAKPLKISVIKVFIVVRLKPYFSSSTNVA